MAFKLPFKAHNYIGEFASEAAALAWIQAMRWDSTKNGAGNPEPGMCFYDTALTAMKQYVAGAWAVVSRDDPGSVACVTLTQAGVPVAGQLLTIGADVYEADGAGANINFAIGAAEATMDNLLAAAVAHGTEDLFWDKIDATHLRIRSAVAPQGALVAADPNLALTENLANYTFDCGTPGNFNGMAGRAAGIRRLCGSTIAVTAAMIANGVTRIAFTAPVLGFTVTLMNAAGAVLPGGGTDAFTIANGDVLITWGGGIAPDLQVTDVVNIIAAI